MYTFLPLIVLINIATALPAVRRFYQPTSPVFSLIAYHKGKEFQYNIVKYNGLNLELARDEPAFYGRVKASNGYTLNIPTVGYDPYDNSSVTPILSNYPFPDANVYVSPEGRLTTKSSNSSSSFGILLSRLTYNNSTQFIACPSWVTKLNWTTPVDGYNASSRLNGSYVSVLPPDANVSNDWDLAAKSWGYSTASTLKKEQLRASWLRYFETFGIFTGTVCPDNVPGYNISLIIQTAPTLNYIPETNISSMLKRLFNREK